MKSTTSLLALVLISISILAPASHALDVRRTAVVVGRPVVMPAARPVARHVVKPTLHPAIRYTKPAAISPMAKPIGPVVRPGVGHLTASTSVQRVLTPTGVRVVVNPVVVGAPRPAPHAAPVIRKR